MNEFQTYTLSIGALFLCCLICRDQLIHRLRGKIFDEIQVVTDNAIKAMEADNGKEICLDLVLICHQAAIEYRAKRGYARLLKLSREDPPEQLEAVPEWFTRQLSSIYDRNFLGLQLIQSPVSAMLYAPQWALKRGEVDTISLLHHQAKLGD